MTSEEQYEALVRRHDELVEQYNAVDALGYSAGERALEAERILGDIAIHEMVILNHPARPIIPC